MISLYPTIQLLRQQSDKIRLDYGVTSLSLFGSVARGEQTEESDLDIFVDMPPKMFEIIGLQQYLEKLLGCKVDVVRNHRSINPGLIKEIHQDAIPIF